MKKSLGANTIVYPTPVWCVGSYDRNGKPNIMTIAWGGICCSQPPCVTVSLRKATYTYGNIMERQAYTVNVPSESFAREADYFGIASGKTVDKFAASGLTPVRSDLVDAPYVREFPMILECKLVHSLEVGLHTLFVGQIMDVKVDESSLDADGKPDMSTIKPLVFAPEVRSYFGIGSAVGKAFSMGKGLQGKNS